jgi:hypothetical protein
MTNTIRQELLLLRGYPPNKSTETSNETSTVIRSCANNEGKSTSSKISRKQSIVFRKYTSLLGKLLIRTVSKTVIFSDTQLQSTSETYSTWASSCAFMPSFLSQTFEYQSFSTCGFVQRALRISPIIPSDHPIWKMCNLGDLEGIQNLLSTRQVSPFSVDTDGLTLLHVCSGLP